MWLPVILYLFININVSFGISKFKNEPLELTDIFLDNLKVDPFLMGDHEISDKSKRFIDIKIEKFVYLVFQSQNAVFSRTKRSLDYEENNAAKYSINITPEQIIPTEYSHDLRIFQYDSKWFAVSLQDKNTLVTFQYLNGSFKEIFQKSIEYNTNIAALSSEDLPLIVVGENRKIKVFQFIPTKPYLPLVQTLKADNPAHVVLWKQAHSTYLSITDTVAQHSKDAKDERSKLKIYKWMGRHFDLIQEMDLFNIKKSVPFNIHGSYFLATVKYKFYEDETKSYSDIFKFDLHSTKFKSYQRILTNDCTDIKYFTSDLHGEKHHFLVVVHSLDKDFNKVKSQNKSKSIIYKYEDQYFIPFQSIQTDAVEWQPIQDNNGDSALLAVTKAGLKGFQYDGWHFFESNIAFNKHHGLKFEDIAAFHTYHFEGEQILVLSCDHCKNSTNVFKVNFTNFNTVKELHSQILSWCIDTLKELESKDEPDVVAESLRGDLNEQISFEEDQKRQLEAALTESNEILISLEDLVDNSLYSNNNHIFISDIEAENVIFNDDVNVTSLKTGIINNINIDPLLDNVLDISDGFNIDNSLEFNVVVSEKVLRPKMINDVLVERYVFLNDDVTLDKLFVDGVVTFEKGVNIKKVLNNITVDEKNVLLKTGDQEFSKNLTVDDIIVHNLTAKYVNQIELKPSNPSEDFIDPVKEKKLQIQVDNSTINNSTANIWDSKDDESLKQLYQRNQPISHLKTLKVKNLDIGGLLNRVSIPVLEKHALKKFGDQILEKTFSFDSLTVEKLDVGEKISGKRIPDDFVMIHAGEYTVNQDIHFLKGLKVNKLEVLHSLNNITVMNEGELDILLIDSPKIQSVPTKKLFNSLTISNPIKLRNKIKNPQMDRINPVIMDNESYHLDGDVIIEGRCEVKQWVKVDDLKGNDGKNSFKDVLERGVKITDTQIPVHLTFTQPLDLEETIANRVNFLNPYDWLLESSDSPQIVKGQKTILGNLYLEGPINTFRLNDIDIHKLQKEALRVEGDQDIEGVMEIDSIVVDKGINSNTTYYGDKPWNKDMHANQSVGVQDFLLINGSLKIENIKANNVEVKGLVNALNISEIIRDVVRKDAKYKVFGHKRFKEFHVDDLVVRGKDLDLIKLLEDVTKNEATLDNNLDLYNEINVENINFGQNLNNVSKENFKSLMDFEAANEHIMTVVPLQREYDQITVFGEVIINNNFINGKNLTSIENDTVKIDEDYEFDHVKFGEAIFVKNLLQLEGNVENLDLNNIVEQNSLSAMEIEGKLFSENVFVNGTLHIETTINGFDLKKICEFSQASAELKQLNIEGDAVFVKGPKILNINGLNLKDLTDNLWFVDREASISGTIRLKNTTFHKSVDVREFVDENNLTLLSQNYFSKSKDQVVPASFSFDNVTFVNISTPRLLTKGPINGIILDDLLKTMLLQNVTQIFEGPAYFEEVKVQDLNEETKYLVNGLNLETDVMLYDASNVVTGHKVIDNLNVKLLKLNRDIKLQGVDVLEWLSNAVLTNGTFSIKQKKILKGATFKQGLSVRGKVNNQEFNEHSIMLIDTPQNVSGKKNFVSSNDTTKFKILGVKGLVNDIHFNSFLQNQSSKNKNNVINSEIVFNNSVVVKNINIDVLYNDVNITELLGNITKLGNLEQFQEKYRNLLDMSLEIENSVKDQASFFKYFKEVMHLNNVYEVFGLKCKDNVFRVVTFSFENGSNIFRTLEWNVYTKEFVSTGVYMESYSIPTFMEQISIGDNDYIYIEHQENLYRDTSVLLHSGKLLQLINSTTPDIVAEFKRNATKSLISFVTPGLNEFCLGFIDVDMSGMEVLCDETGSHNYYRFQIISMIGIYKATTLRTPESLYLFLAVHGNPFKEPSIVVLESYAAYPQFQKTQIIFEGSDLNGLTAASIGNTPFVAFSFGPQEATIHSGRISIKKLEPITHQFIQWQHIPLTAPLEVHFAMTTSIEPLLLAPSADISAPLQILRYEGSAGFKSIFKGSALPPGSRIRVIQEGAFLVALQGDRAAGIILEAVIKGPIKN